MPHGMDIEDDTAQTRSEFECLDCGAIIEVANHPGTCSQCGAILQNRAKSLE